MASAVAGCTAVLMTIVALAEAPAAGWSRIDAPPSLSFPRDHGAHFEVQTEWWYLTANLVDSDKRRYGVQVTFFRRGIDPTTAHPGQALLRARHLLAAHVAVAEVDDGRFRHAERIRRVDGGFAGASADDLAVWIGDWELERGDGDVLSARASDRAAGIAVDLQLRPTKPLVSHGDGGYSRKGVDPGNASIYVSWTRLEVRGTVTLDGRKVELAGAGWYDHEWGTSQLGDRVVGWDWFSLRLSDGSELMIYRLRRRDGSEDPLSSGTLVNQDGSSRRLTPDEVVLESTGRWTSPDTGGDYPSGWRVRVPSEGIDLEVSPVLSAAEIDGRASTGVIYWEGPVTVSGTQSGEGYVELTGYAGSLAGRL